MPSALWAYYDRELWRGIHSANAAGDADRLARLLAQAIQFEQLILLLDDQRRWGEVRRDIEWLMRRVVELSLAREDRESVPM
jgi:hypothetical protein